MKKWKLELMIKTMKKKKKIMNKRNKEQKWIMKMNSKLIIGSVEN